MSNSLSYVLMMDNSGSMLSAIDQVRINAHAFIGWSRVQDQFGILTFNDRAAWLYPSGTAPNILEVSKSYEEVNDAFGPIESVRANGGTNIGDAIRLGNAMILKARHELQAFVLISDGEHNPGTPPVQMLGATPPLFVAGIGDYLKESYFTDLINKNPRSRFYHEPDAGKMTEMFEDIVSDATLATLLLQKTEAAPRGTGRFIEQFYVSRPNSFVSLHLVWNNAKMRHTNGTLTGNTYKITVTGPGGTVVPVINHGGLSVLTLDNPRVGSWQITTDYSADSACACTFGAFDYAHIPFKLDAHAEAGKINISVDLFDKAAVDGATVSAQIERPAMSVENALKKYANELAEVSFTADPDSDPEISRLKALRESKLPNMDILARETSSTTLEPSIAGQFIRQINAATPGIYNIRVIAEGVDPETGERFRQFLRRTVIVESL